MITKELFQQYAQMQIQKREIESRMEQIKPALIEEILKEEADKIELEEGSFIIMKRKVLEYTEAVQYIADQLKEKKREEEAKGIALFEINNVLVFKTPAIDTHIASPDA